jgi:hypothetical protein
MPEVAIARALGVQERQRDDVSVMQETQTLGTTAVFKNIWLAVSQVQKMPTCIKVAAQDEQLTAVEQVVQGYGQVAQVPPVT